MGGEMTDIIMVLHQEVIGMVSFEEIKITRIIAEEITTPPNTGSEQYAVPFALSRTPTTEWRELFIANWNAPLETTGMHRPRRAEITGDKLILTRTTIEEVELHHKRTLLRVVEKTNRDYQKWLVSQEQEKQARAQEKERQEERRRHAADIADRIKFE